MSSESSTEETTPQTGSPQPAPTSEVALAAERDQLLADKAELQDRLLRRQAEFENFRRRTEQERLRFFEFAGMETARELLPILDNFGRALKVPHLDREYVKGIELIHQQLLDTLIRAGLEPLETEGRIFDPNLHQAVDREETVGAEDQTIMAEYQKGYNFKGKLLRPAMVKVAVKPPAS